MEMGWDVEKEKQRRKLGRWEWWRIEKTGVDVERVGQERREVEGKESWERLERNVSLYVINA